MLALSPPTPAASCPFASGAARFQSKRSGSQSRARTLAAPPPPPPLSRQSAPDPEKELIHLPPLLSLLPLKYAGRKEESSLSNLNKLDIPTTFDFDRPTVGFTSSRLAQVDDASVALHDALYAFKPVTKDYALVPYESAFNWDELVLPLQVEREWYIVAFRSTRAPGSSSVDLIEADRLAHEEAVGTGGGLLAYWFGVVNDRGINLATCIWMSRAHAISAVSGPSHLAAMKLASKMYSSYELERYILKKVKGETGVSIEPWTGGEVAF